MSTFYPPDRLPHRFDFEKLAAFNPIARQFLLSYRDGDIDYETCVLGTALALADQNKYYIDKLVGLSFKVPFTTTIPPSPKETEDV